MTQETQDFDYDLFVIGAGSGGVRCARMSAAMGARVAIAEERYLGGTCVNVGCVPKKLFYYGSHVREELELAESFGWTLGTVSFDWDQLRDSKSREIERLNGVYERLLGNNGVDILNGRATVSALNTIEINGRKITARNILVATGGWPFRPDLPGIEHCITSNEFFYLDTLPDRALVVGGGYIGIEFACILHNLGVGVTLSYRRELFLRGFDLDVRRHLKTALENKGIKLAFNHDIASIELEGNGVKKVVDVQGNVSHHELIIYATGRNPLSGKLGLESLGVKLSENGAIKVDSHFQTDCRGIFAIGDVIDRVQLTPVALAEGMYLANYLFGKPPPPLNYNNIPTAVFTQPSIGTVGMTEDQARDQGHSVSVFRSEFTPMKYSFSNTKEKTLMKLVVDSQTDRVLGVHMVGPEAGEIIQGIAIAVNMGATKAQFDQTIGIHPTSAEEFVTMRTPVT